MDKDIEKKYQEIMQKRGKGRPPKENREKPHYVKKEKKKVEGKEEEKKEYPKIKEVFPDMGKGIEKTRKSKEVYKNSKYSDAFPPMLEKLYEEYKTEYGVAAALGVSKGTYDIWVEKHEEFRNAHHYCKDKFKGWYLKYLIENFGNQSLNTSLVIFFGKTYFKMNDRPEDEDEKHKRTQETIEQTIRVMEKLKEVHKPQEY